jgi:hypothetical protein
MNREFSIGDRVTVKSILSKSHCMGKTIMLETANYPHLIGTELTIVDLLPPWILCVRPTGIFVPALTEEDLELLAAVSNEVQS